MSLPPDAARPLDYAAPDRGRRLLIDVRHDGGVTITVPTRRLTVSRILQFDPSFVLFLPLIWPFFRLFASREPRAVLRLTPEEFTIIERSDDGLGLEAVSRSWPRASVSELRPNRYVNGLYLRVAGKENMDLLTDLPPPEIWTIGAALRMAQQKLAARDVQVSTASATRVSDARV